MPRQERTKSGTGIYHVMLRGINKQDIFEDDEDYLQMTSIKTKMITEPSLGHYIGDNYVTIKNDKYDFDMHPWDSFKEIVRNLETIGADLIHGKGTPFEIKFKGVNKINHTYNKIKNIIL